MTKILYLPTGRYLKFYDEEDININEETDTIEHSELYTRYNEDIETIIDWLMNNIPSNIFLERNAIDDTPIPREHLEIIND